MIRLAPHVHSDWSYDGRWSLERIATAFARRGYGAVLLCEHCRTFDRDRWRRHVDACRIASDGGATLVPGIEYADPDNVVHLPVWGLDDFVGAEVPTEAVLERLRDAGDTFAVLAHPARRDAWRRFAPAWAEALQAVETWNRKTDGIVPAAGPTLQPALDAGLAPTLALDFHGPRQWMPFAIELPQRTLTADHDDAVAAVIADLRSGAWRPTVAGVPLEAMGRRWVRPALGGFDAARRVAARIAPRR